MSIISIIGTSGVGKSFLVKQLAILDGSPAFFECEEGAIPDEIMESVFSGGSPIKRWEWFRNHYHTQLERAMEISQLGMTCYTDGSPMSFEAILFYEERQYHNELRSIIDTMSHIMPDKTLLLTATKEKLAELIELRGRVTENLDETLKRAIDIQDNYIALVKEKENVITVDRSNFDFTKSKDLNYIRGLL